MDRSFNSMYGEQCAKVFGPVDICQPGYEPLLGTYMARPNVPLVRVTAERVSTSSLMALMTLGEQTSNVFVRKSLKAKVGFLLRKRGLGTTGRLAVKWEPGTGVEKGAARKLVDQALRESVGSLQPREYWSSRLMWTDGKTKTIAEGGKNRRRVAQRVDLGVQRAMADHERWSARRDSEILLVNYIVHIPRPDEAEAAFQRNTEAVMKVARAVHMPVSSRKKIERALAAKWKASTPPASTAEHRAYAAW